MIVPKRHHGLFMFSAESISLLHVQLEWVTCTQVSTLLLREDASGLQLAAVLADRTSRCDLPQT